MRILQAGKTRDRSKAADSYALCRVLEDLRLAKEAIEQQNARQRGEHLSRAVAIVSTLLTSLDSNVTDELWSFYGASTRLYSSN